MLFTATGLVAMEEEEMVDKVITAAQNPKYLKKLQAGQPQKVPGITKADYRAWVAAGEPTTPVTPTRPTAKPQPQPPKEQEVKKAFPARAQDELKAIYTSAEAVGKAIREDASITGKKDKRDVGQKVMAQVQLGIQDGLRGKKK